MKQILLSLAAGLTTASAFAHSAALPHTHHADHVNWLPGIASAAAVAIVVGLILRRRMRTRRETTHR